MVVVAHGVRRTRVPTECPLSLTVNKLVLSCKDYEDERSLKIAINAFFISSTYSIQTIREEIFRQFAPPAELDQVAYRLLRLIPKPDDVTESICRENEAVDEASQSKPKGDGSQDQLYCHSWPTHFPIVKKIITIHEQYEQEMLRILLLDRDCQEKVRSVLLKLEDSLQQLREFVEFKKEQAGVDQNSQYQCPRPIISGAGLESHCGTWLSSLIHQASKDHEKERMKAKGVLNNEVSIIMGRDINSNGFVKERSKKGGKKKSEICPDPSADLHVTVKKKRGRKRKNSGPDRKALSELPIQVCQQVKSTKNSGRVAKVPSRLVQH
ncbi:hypothetical protein M9434_000805 [Picochlorum sp. BPE23]|nr:hypothetical protein M9434_000805 [Picochlorum sp. BPE23]